MMILLLCFVLYYVLFIYIYIYIYNELVCVYIYLSSFILFAFIYNKLLKISRFTAVAAFILRSILLAIYLVNGLQAVDEGVICEQLTDAKNADESGKNNK